MILASSPTYSAWQSVEESEDYCLKGNIEEGVAYPPSACFVK